jgi:uncharacterized protein YdaU (DUF1376 family)
MHYYQHHIGDFIKDTSFLTNEEIGIYLKLIWLYYDTEKPLPNNLFELGMRTATRDNQVVLEGILGMFFIFDEQNQCWNHTRCDKEIENYKQLLNTASKAGKASAIKRALNKESTSVERALNERSTDVQPTNNHKPITNNHIDTPDGVDKLVWEDFLQIRKKRRAPISDRVIEGLTEQAKAAGVTLNDALKECVLRGWQSFKADWIKPKVVDIAKQTVPSRQGRDPVLLKIEEESKQAVPPSLEVLERMAKIRKGVA